MGFIPPPIPTGDAEADRAALLRWCRSQDRFRIFSIILLEVAIATVLVLLAMISNSK